MVEPDDGRTRRETAWLSEGFEQLIKRLEERTDRDEVDFDVVIVGSGYGGAATAALLSQHFAEHSLDAKGVCILERGREYLQGMFPTRLSEVPEHVRFSSGDAGARGVRTGLFDFRLNGDVAAVIASGLGGGSLINAGVMAKPDDEVFAQEPWPTALRQGSQLAPWFERAVNTLGAKVFPEDERGRARLMQRLGGDCKTPPLTIAFDAEESAGGVALDRCNRCGDCATGCNYGAKQSLDTNLLWQAKRHGAHIFSGAAVERIERGDDGHWVLCVSYTDPKLRRRQGDALRLVAKKVVLSAGVFGSTEILLRSQTTSLTFSPRLGHRFSANGDSLVTLANISETVAAVADEGVPPDRRDVGPTITRTVQVRKDDWRDAFVIQDLTVPAALRRVFQEVVALSLGFDDLASSGRKLRARRDPCAIDETEAKHTLLLALIGHDDAKGRIELVGGEGDADGAVRVTWPDARADPRLQAREDYLKNQLSGPDDPRVLANPLWRIVPPELEFLFKGARGPLVTTHPLGGCPMGNDAASGVVDDCGRVYDPTRGDGAVHAGLVVLDGSIIPTSLGINPALTITALSLRAVTSLAAEWFPAQKRTPQAQSGLAHRPVFRRINVHVPQKGRESTQIVVLERLSGSVKHVRSSKPLFMQLTLHSRPTEIKHLMSPIATERVISFDPSMSKVRLFPIEAERWAEDFSDDDLADREALFIAPIERGTLHVLQPSDVCALRRTVRALWAWFHNRGARDIWQASEEGDPWQKEIVKRLVSTLHLASLAGEERLFEYNLTLGRAQRGGEVFELPETTTRLRLIKRLTYGRRSNPWRQMMTARWAGGPFSGASRKKDMTLDLRYLERCGVPLIRLVKQDDLVAALVDASSLFTYVMRTLLRIHTWSFRKPDARPRGAPEPRRFPSEPAGMRIRNVYTVEMKSVVDAPPDEPRAKLRLTRFDPGKGAHGTPVLMIHGYSTSSTTFAHHTAPSLAKHLWERGWDPWVLDMRTSAAMDTARYPWSFEQVGYSDIPVAIDRVLAECGAERLCVIAHCMGAAMICMGLLGDLPDEQATIEWPSEDPPDPYPALRRAMRKRISAMVLSQVTPHTVFSPANLMRAFVMQYLRYYLVQDDFSFRVERPIGLQNQLLDRLLSTLPYPEDEFDSENPPLWRFWQSTPWTATRHRMDALYGRDFSVKRISREVLGHIDDLFGPLNIQTVAQGIHLARCRELTDRFGVRRFVTRDRIARGMKMPVLSLHGAENGLVDVSTVSYMNAIYREICDDVAREARRVDGFGHQDMLIGKRAERAVYPMISSFLAEKGLHHV